MNPLESPQVETKIHNVGREALKPESSGDCFVNGVARSFCEFRLDICGHLEAGLMHDTGKWYKSDGSVHHDGLFEHGKILKSSQGSGSCSLR